MLYKQYQLYNNMVEIMLPKNLKQTDDLFRDYLWVSEDRQTVISITRGIREMDSRELVLRLQDYYLEYQNAVAGFKCLYVKKRMVHRQEFGEMYYESELMGYKIHNFILLGIFEKREFIMTLQCGEPDKTQQLHAFNNVMESLKIQERRREEDHAD